MKITIAYAPRENAYVWAYDPQPGHAPFWRKGKPTLDATRSELEARHPQATFTVQAG